MLRRECPDVNLAPAADRGSAGGRLQPSGDVDVDADSPRRWFHRRVREMRQEGLAVLSGLLLAAAFPPLGWAPVAWIALVPLGLACFRQPHRRAVKLGYVGGVTFFVLNLAFLRHVTVTGWILLALYCGLYFIPPAIFLARGTPALASPRAVPARAAWLVGWTAVWTASEFLRGTLFTGFPWNPLGVSQFRQISVIQLAAWGGVWAVSALVAWVNGVIIATCNRYRCGPASERLKGRHLEMLLALSVVAVAVLHGERSIRALPAHDASVRVALIQPAIPQHVKWDDAFVAGIYHRLETLSVAAARAGRPELLVWPETAIPGDLRGDERAIEIARAITATGAHLLAGALEIERDDTGAPRFFNSAILMGPNGAILEVYDKQHLVLFGEYVPFGHRFPWLRRLTPVVYDVEPGHKPVIFRVPRPDAPFAALICFEDVFPYLGRRFARAGARWFVNMTNDAWYDFSSGSRQHLANAVFRCVETRRPMVRSGNTGITCWIDVAGRVGGDGTGGTGILPHYGPNRELIPGFLTAEIPLPPDGALETPYVRHGDVFAVGCLIVGGGSFVARWFGSRRHPVDDLPS